MPTSYPSVSGDRSRVDLALIAVPRVSSRAWSGLRSLRRAAGRRYLGRLRRVGGERQGAPGTLTNLFRTSGMRMIGPNCMGVLNTAPEVLLDATFAPTWPPAGNIGMLSQSGALGITMLDYVEKLRLGLSTFVSVGNKADVSGNDLLAYWADDPRTEVIVLYLESFGNPRKFARLAPQVARKTPIIAVKSGRSARHARARALGGARASTSRDAFRAAGVIRTNTSKISRRRPHWRRSRARARAWGS